MFIGELCAAWHLEPGSPQTTMYLNAFLEARCEEDGVEAEPCNALAISFSGDMPLPRDAENRRGTTFCIVRVSFPVESSGCWTQGP